MLGCDVQSVLDRFDGFRGMQGSFSESWYGPFGGRGFLMVFKVRDQHHRDRSELRSFQVAKNFHAFAAVGIKPVSYTHLTLPTIYSV